MEVSVGGTGLNGVGLDGGGVPMVSVMPVSIGGKLLPGNVMLMGEPSGFSGPVPTGCAA